MKTALTIEQLEAIADYEEHIRNQWRHDGQRSLVRDFRHEIIDLMMIETATSKPNETRVNALRESMTILERLSEEAFSEN